MITEKMKSKVAANIADIITEIVINDSISVTNFTAKSVSKNVAIINFQIDASIGSISGLKVMSGFDVLSECKLFLDVKEEGQVSYRVEVTS